VFHYHPSVVHGSVNFEQGVTVYLVKWKGYDVNKATYLPASDLQPYSSIGIMGAINADIIRDAQECLDDYWRSKQLDVGSDIKFPKVLQGFSNSALQNDLTSVQAAIMLHQG